MEPLCTIDGCERLAYTRGMCQMHYKRVLLTGDPGPPGPKSRTKSTCQVVDCQNIAEAKGYCHGHYQRMRRGAEVVTPLRVSERICTVDGCGRPHQARGYCPAHYKRFLATGDPQADRPIRQVKGWGHLNHGYVIVPVPRAMRRLVGGATKVGEHRLVMALHLGRPLLADEVVHHMNGRRTDNRIENLELWSTAHPKGQRVVDLVAFSIEMLARYAPEVGSRVLEKVAFIPRPLKEARSPDRV